MCDGLEYAENDFEDLHKFKSNVIELSINSLYYIF